MSTETGELEPFLLCDQVQGRCATWRLEANQALALAFFLSEENAENYRQSAALVGEWQVVQPSRSQLAEIIVAALDGGVSFAVVDPTENGAKRLFHLDAMREQLQIERGQKE